MTDGIGEENNSDEKSTKQKILSKAVDLFAKKGFTETTIRELADAAGLKGASIYNHFPSKNAILECILEEYASQVAVNFLAQDKLHLLENDPTPEGILTCLMLLFPKGREEYFLTQLCVILQEQYRNPVVRRFMCEEFILNIEQTIKMIFNKLIEFNKIHPDTDSDFWARMHSSVVYAYSSRRLLGIGDNMPDFLGKTLVDQLKALYAIMFSACRLESDGDVGVDAG